jgi:hypothetical protein
LTVLSAIAVFVSYRTHLRRDAKKSRPDIERPRRSSKLMCAFDFYGTVME